MTVVYLQVDEVFIDFFRSINELWHHHSVAHFWFTTTMFEVRTEQLNKLKTSFELSVKSVRVSLDLRTLFGVVINSSGSTIGDTVARKDCTQRSPFELPITC